MKKPSRKPFRNRRITPGQIRILQTLWSTRLRREGKRMRAEVSRQERLQHISEIVRRPVQSAKELNWREANRVIERLLQEAGAQGTVGVETSFAEQNEDEAVPGGRLSSAQLWKIRQIAQYLGWSASGECGQRLSGFLRSKFHVEQPEELTHDQAWRAIEALCAAGARERLQRRQGKKYSVPHEELTREISALKHELEGWRPAQQCA